MKILNQLTLKELKMNKQRTIVTLIGVILSCALMVGIGLIFSSSQKNMVDSIVIYSGDYHVRFDQVKIEDLSLIENNIKVKEYAYTSDISFALGEEYEKNFFFLLRGMDDNYHKSFRDVKGKYPTKANEILVPDTLLKQYEPYLKIGDSLTLRLGKRYLDGELTNETVRSLDETFEEEETKTYKIVGTYEYDAYPQTYYSELYVIYTGGNLKTTNSNVYITYKNVGDTYDESEHIASQLGLQDVGDGLYQNMTYHQEYLSALGHSRYGNYNTTMVIILGVILSLISIACIIVIYNSFHISVMERKKQFGIFASIGATKSQLMKTVFLEAFIVAIIGIPIGVLAGMLGIKITLEIVMNLAPDLFSIPFTFYIYPIFIIVPVVFMIVVIFLSAYLPARKAGKMQPMEAIRQNDDIKIEKKKIKTPKIIRKLFGIEGDIALKNIKRNRKKYRVTVVSLFISIVLFITFSGLLKYGLYGTDTAFQNAEYDAMISVTAPTYEDMKPIFYRLKKVEGPEQSKEIHWTYTTTKIDASNYYEEYKNQMENIMDLSIDELDMGVIVATIDETDYQQLLDDYNEEDGTVFLVNQVNFSSVMGTTRKTYSNRILKPNSISNLTLYCDKYDDSGNYQKEICADSINHIKMIETVPYGLQNVITDPSYFTIVVPESFYQSFVSRLDESGYSYATTDLLYMNGTDFKNIEKEVENIEDEGIVGGIYYENIEQSVERTNRIILAVKILLYGFIALVTFIGITSVFNTIVTSLALRKREFAMLRSVGLSPKGFRKILFLESFFFVFKAYLVALPVSIILIGILHYAFNYSMYIESLLIPWDAVLIALLFSYAIVLITTMYATRKVRTSNILESIREENI